MRFEIFAKGHENITATHKTTLEITKDKELTPRGNCIIGVCSNVGLKEIPDRAKELLKKGVKADVKIFLPDYNLYDELYGFGDPALTFEDPSDIVIRKSKYVCSRTFLVQANKAACDINREMVELLKDEKTELVLIVKLHAPLD
ncbi:hypothetical protein B6U96_14355 [Archaeoglobales archaeon ex4484_92]|nr:MAG: hypothetical protein B6U96_14355 [Archaeoglobales archaeon ex4484_92]